MEVCSFTGHRNIKSEHRSQMPTLIERALKYAYDKGCRKFLTGGAVGFDTEAARAIIKFRISHPDAKFILILPCINQDEKWTPQQRSVYEYTLSEANEVVYVSEEYDSDCLRLRNQELAKRCDILIAYVSRNNSGAAQTVRIAHSLGKEVYNLYPTLDGAGSRK